MFLGWQDLLVDLWHNNNENNNNNNINILVIGGAMTAGFGLHYKNEAWPNIIKKTINNNKLITISTLAGIGQGSQYYANNSIFWSTLKANKTNILIIEFSIEDSDIIINSTNEINIRSYPQHLYNLLTHIKEVSPNTQIMALVTSHITGDITNDKVLSKSLKETCETPTEVTALTIYAKSNGIKVAWCHHWWYIANIQQTIYRELGIPYFSYRDAIWPFLHTPTDSLTVRWNSNTQPNSYTHNLIAMGIIKLIEMVCETTCSHFDNGYLTIFDNLPSSISPEYKIESEKNNLEKLLICENTSSILIDNEFKAQLFDSQWIYGLSERTHHRIGWRNEDESNIEQNLIFSIKSGPKYILMFEYLSSHIFYGRVNVYIGTSINQVISSQIIDFQLSTYWTRALSIPHWKTYQISLSIQKNLKKLKSSLIYIRLSYSSNNKPLPTKKSAPIEVINYNRTKPLFLLYSITAC